jgi:hypothetical protein
MMEAASTSETSVNRLHSATTQKTAIFILAAVRTSNLTHSLTVISFDVIGI